jgi:hypothetical protein
MTERPDRPGARAVRRVLDVAPKFPVDPVNAADGHHFAYHTGLQDEAARFDIRWEILAPRSTRTERGLVRPVLDTSSPDELASSLSDYLSQQDGRTLRDTAVVLYEGNRQILEAIQSSASRFSDVRFLVNFFSPDPGLDIPFVAKPVPIRHRRPWRSTEVPTAPSVLAPCPNVMVCAETPQRILALRSVGLDPVGEWPIQSAVRSEGSVRASVGDPLRVLIPLAAWQLDQQAFADVSAVASSLDMSAGLQLRIAGMWKQRRLSRPVRNRLRRLERQGVTVEIDSTPPANEQYFDRFIESDAIWLPKGHPYRYASSGKALDALVLGRPVIAPAGTYAAREMQRWVPGMPSYATPEEAIDVFRRLPLLMPAILTELSASLPSIRERYAVSRTLDWLRESLESASARPT